MSAEQPGVCVSTVLVGVAGAAGGGAVWSPAVRGGRRVLGAFRSQPHSLSEDDAFSGEDRFAFLLPAAGIAPLGGQQCFLV